MSGYEIIDIKMIKIEEIKFEVKGVQLRQINIFEEGKIFEIVVSEQEYMKKEEELGLNKNLMKELRDTIELEKGIVEGEYRMDWTGQDFIIQVQEEHIEMRLGTRDIKKVKIPLEIKVNVTSTYTEEGVQEEWIIVKGKDRKQLTQFINKIRQIKPAYKDKYKEKGFGPVIRIN